MSPLVLPSSKMSNIEGAPPTKKRKRNAKAGSAQTANSGLQSRHTRGRRGLLRKLVTDAPLDVVFEVFAYLSLPDLLAISRSSKGHSFPAFEQVESLELKVCGSKSDLELC
ncbi:hypothetical protein DL96DRAFT_415899 [Flagelloscypha sp. PMI_526]|nr:hypothetical protein DL96DRAFT_415899 [Flagelloscypha sp. PMI_526]